VVTVGTESRVEGIAVGGEAGLHRSGYAGGADQVQRGNRDQQAGKDMFHNVNL
jgi:hypothetical protein